MLLRNSKTENVNILIQSTRLPNSLAYNNPRRVDKSINHPNQIALMLFAVLARS